MPLHTHEDMHHSLLPVAVDTGWLCLSIVIPTERDEENEQNMNMTSGSMYSMREENNPGRDQYFPSTPNWHNRIQG